MKKSVMTAVFFLILIIFLESTLEEKIVNTFEPVQKEEIVQTDSEEIVAQQTIVGEEKVNESLYIGLTTANIKSKYGEPVRKDRSAYDYEWWIYPNAKEGYLQVGIENDVVVTAYVVKREHDETYEQLNQSYLFSQQVEVKSDHGQFSFQLTRDDVKTRPLVSKDGVWIQFYFDTHTNYLSSIRYMNADTLLKQVPYSITYRGELPKKRALSQEEWKLVEKGETKQIFDVTNVIRKRHQLPPLEWEEEVATVAYLHSKEMKEHHYFSHTSPISGELKDRLERGNILYQLAGENIAAQYVDGVSAVEGWLNSEGHRVNVLHDEFTHVGVGVFQNYYTQNFLIPIYLPQ